MTIVVTTIVENGDTRRSPSRFQPTMVTIHFMFIDHLLIIAGSHRGTPQRGSSLSDSDESDFGIRRTKRRRIGKVSHKPKFAEIIPAERTSSRLGAKVVNYNEVDDESVNEEDLMPNEFGEVWTYGMLSVCCY